LVVRTEKKGAAEQPDEGERWGCLVQDRDSRFVVACATGPLSEELIEQAVTTTLQRTRASPLCWFSDGWHGYGSILERAYRQPVRTGKRGRPRLVVPQTLSLTQTIKHRDERGRLLSVEIRATLGAKMKPAGTVHVERLNRALRLQACDGVHRYQQRSPAMALGLTEHLWSFQDLLTTRIPITP